MNLLISLLIFCNTPYYRAPVKEAPPQIEGKIVWVYFTDKGFRTEREYEKVIENFVSQLSEDAIERRLNYSGRVFDFDDLPVYQRYIDEIVSLGGKMRTVSNWLNAVSFEINPAIIERLYYLPFVYNIAPVAIQTEKIIDGIDIERDCKSSEKIDTTFYGLSYLQNKMLGIPSVFNKGYTGSRVKLGLLDTGLKRKHNALNYLKIFKEHDFLGGDNFFIAKSINNIEAIPQLSNISLAAAPQFYKTASNRLFIFYTADTIINDQPYRGLFCTYSNNLGVSWSDTQALYITLTYNMSLPTVSVSGKDSVVYVAWQDLLPQAPYQPVTNNYLGYFTNTQWNSGPQLGNGKNPNIFAKGNNLYITYTNNDSILYFRRADISYVTPLLLNPVVVSTFNEPIANPVIVTDSVGEIEIFALGLHSQVIYHYKSTDNGYNFDTLAIIDSFAGPFKVQISGNQIYLAYKDYTNSPNVKITLRKSFDGGNNWSSKDSATSPLLTMGDFSLAGKDTIYIAYEMQGNIYLTKSTDIGNTWTEANLIAQDFNYSPKVNIVNNQPYIIWFQRGDNNTDYEEGKDFLEQPNHGTRMASLIAGYQPRSLIGTAPGVDLLICKTELFKARTGYTYETTTEEDIWVQGLEWAERQGAQVISSSLGYRSWYTDKDFDGRTIPISVAAGLAAKRGVIIVSAMGNRDTLSFPWPHPYIVAPGDAFDIITAGGVTKALTPWLRTGIGPTYDGRIKPELSALADTAIVVAPDSTDSYEGSIGTSCATALLAGCCAVILEAHPNWNADSVRHALFTTASLNVPNCTLGYGIPNIDSLLKIYPPTRVEYEKDQLGYPLPNPYLNLIDAKIYFPLLLMKKPFFAEIRIFTITGELIKVIDLNKDLLSLGRYVVEQNTAQSDRTELENIGAVWDGKNEAGKKVASGLYFALLRTSNGEDLKKFAVVR